MRYFFLKPGLGNGSNNLEENSSNTSTESESKSSTSPDFTVLDYDGNAVKLSDFKGEPVVINFWATWCYYCKEEMQDFNDANKKYLNVKFMMIDAADGYKETAKSYVES